MIEVRPATAAEIEVFFGKRPRSTMYAVAGVLEGEVVSVGGLFRHEHGYTAFWNIKPGHEAAMKSMPVLRAIKRVMRKAASLGLPVFAVGENPELLERLGFERTEGDNFQWANTRDT